MISAKAINDFHRLTKKKPQEFSRKIHKMVRFVELLLEQGVVEYKPTDPLHFEEFCKNHIRHYKGIWAERPLILSIEQRWIFHCILGLKEKRKIWLDGKWTTRWGRFFQEAYVFVARKWGKTLVLSAFYIWMGLCDKEQAAECYSLAGNATQAARLFNNAKFFIENDPYLKMCFRAKRENNKQYLYIKGTQSFLSYDSGTPKGKAGSDPHFVNFDELHEITNLELFKNVISGQGGRFQPLAFSISSAGTTRGSLYDSKLEEIERICKLKKLDNKSRIFFAVFEIDPDDDPDDEKCWIKANPGMREGRPNIGFLRKEHRNSLFDIVARPTFLAQNLNRPSNNAMTYITLDDLKNARINITQDMYYNCYAYGGVDLSETTDLTSATALIPVDPNCERFIFLQKYFVAEKRIEQNSERDKMLYKSFCNTTSKDPAVKELLHICKGSFVDKQDVAEWFLELELKYKVTFLKIGYDPYHKNEFIKYCLQAFSHETVTKDENGVEVRDGGVMTMVRQGATTMSEPIKRIKAAFSDGLIMYDSTNALFEFCVNNLKVNIDRNLNVTLEKAKSTGRIDGVASLVDAWVAMERGTEIYLNNMPTNSEYNKYQAGEKSIQGIYNG